MSSLYMDSPRNRRASRTGLESQRSKRASPRLNMYSQIIERKQSIEQEYRALQRSINKLYSQIDKEKGRLRELTTGVQPLNLGTRGVRVVDEREKARLVVHEKGDLRKAEEELERVEQMVSEPILMQLKLDVSREWEELRNIRDRMKRVVLEIESIRRQIEERRESRERRGIDEQVNVIKTLEIQVQTLKQRKARLEGRVYAEEERKVKEEREVDGLEWRLADVVENNKKLEAEYVRIVAMQRKEREETESLIKRLNQAKSGGPKRRIFVGVFKEKVREAKVESMFAKFGKIEFVKVMASDQRTPQYFALVQFVESASAEAALKKFAGEKELRVQWASEQPE